MTREIYIDRRRSSLAKQGEGATLKPGQIKTTMEAIDRASKKYSVPSVWARRSK